MSAEMYPVPRGRREPFRITIENYDGDPCHHFVKDGPVEIWLLAGPGRADRDGATVGSGEMRYMVEVLKFPNYPIARQHADALALVCRLLQNAIDDAREHAADPIPAWNDGHRHVVRFARYARALPFVAMCEICMQELVPDVVEWARTRGLVAPDERPSILAVSLRNSNTIAEAIEKAFNQDGGTDG